MKSLFALKKDIKMLSIYYSFKSSDFLCIYLYDDEYTIQSNISVELYHIR